jgi:ABC-type lipoprotein release transport system permease subunit
VDGKTFSIKNKKICQLQEHKVLLLSRTLKESIEVTVGCQVLALCEETSCKVFGAMITKSMVTGIYSFYTDGK